VIHREPTLASEPQEKTAPVEYQTDPSRYRHWRFAVDGALLVRINPRESQVPSDVRHVSIPGGALAALRAIDEAISRRA